MHSSQLQCLFKVGGLLGDALLPFPNSFLVYISLFLLYNKWTSSIRLSLEFMLKNAIASPQSGFGGLLDRKPLKIMHAYESKVKEKFTYL